MDDSFRQLELLSRQINQAHRCAINSELAARGLNEIGHPMLLCILQSSDRDPEARCFAQRDLAELLHISPAAVANSLKSLEKGGYITRTPGQDDARRNQIQLTDKGRDAIQGCVESFAAVSHRMLSGFTPEEQLQLLSFRQRMLNNLRGSRAPACKKEEA